MKALHSSTERGVVLCSMHIAHLSIEGERRDGVVLWKASDTCLDQKEYQYIYIYQYKGRLIPDDGYSMNIR
jgi:hypothetical protein